MGGRGWIARAAHLKKPRRGFFPAGLFGGSYELRLPLFPQPLGRALKKRSAVPASPPCFRRRRRSAPLLFESTLATHFARQIKQKLRYPLDTGVLGGRGWIARAALLKTAHWAVFALSSATAPQLFESTRSMSLALLQNKNLSVLAYVEAFWWSEAT